MKTAPVSLSLRYIPVLMLVLGAVFVAVPVHAQIVQETDMTTPVNTSSDGNVTFYMGTSTVNQTVSSISVWLGNSAFVSPDTVTLRITCFANTYSSSQTGCNAPTTWTSDGATISVASTFGQSYGFTYSSGIAMQSGKVYVAEILSTAGIQVYGHATEQFHNQCTYFPSGLSDCTGAPYFTFDSVPDWTGLNATSTALTALYQSGASSTLGIIQARCTGTGGGIFGEALCATFAFLFVPDPSIINGYVALPTNLQSRFPVSYVAGVSAAFDALSASTTSNMVSVSLPFHSIGIGTSSPLGLANIVSADVDAFSTTTIEKYIGATYWALFQSLIALAMWLTFAGDVFFTVRNQMHRV